MKHIKRPLSLLLSVLMVISLFTVVPVAANAAEVNAEVKMDPVEEVTAMLNALPDEVTVDDKADIEAARAAYDDLTDDQKAQISDEDYKKLTKAEKDLENAEDIAAALAVTKLIRALPGSLRVTLDDRDAIEEAAAAFDALTDYQQSLVPLSARLKLNADRAVLAAEVKEVEDQAAADAVTAQINELPASGDVTLKDKEAIEAAAAAYDALTDDQKDLVPLAAKLKLAADKAVLTAGEKDIEDTAAADAVEALIRALPAAADVTLADKPAVDEAQAAYDALTADQKKMVNLTDRVKLAQDVIVAAKLANDKAAADAVTEQINALPAAEEVTYDDMEAITDARAAYEALTDDQKALVEEDVCNKLAEDEAALDEATEAFIVSEMIENLPAAEDITINDKQAIEDTREAYEALSDEQKDKVGEETYGKLTAAEEALAQAEADVVAAQAVAEMIEALPGSLKVTLDDKDAVEEAAAAYDALTDAQKKLVPFADRFKLTAVKAALAAAEKSVEDQAAADAVTVQINALPAALDVTVDDKGEIEAAAAAYDALTDDQKDLVPFAAKLKLAAAKAALTTEEKYADDTAAADAVEELIRALPAPDFLTLDGKDAVEEAAAAYEALTSDQKKMVNLTDRVKLAMDKAAIEKLEDDKAAADAVTDQINALPAAEEVTFDDMEAITDARAAYEALTNDQKALIEEDTYNKLAEDEEALSDIIEVLTVSGMLENLPAAEDVTINDKKAIEATRDAFDALSDEQKAQIGEEALNKLTAAEEALEQIEADIEAAQTVADMIEALPNPFKVTTEDKDAIEEAAAAYEALTDDQKALVPLADRIKLTADQTALAAAEKYAEDRAAADAVTAKINALPAALDVTISDKDAIEEAAAAYDALTDDQKDLVPLAARLKLTAVKAAFAAGEKYIDDTAAADAVEELIRALPAADSLTLDDKTAVDEASAAYDALTNDQKKMVNLTDRVKLALDKAVIEKLVEDKAAADAVTEQINALPAAEEVTIDDMEAITDARAAYETLTNDQKALIDEETYNKLAADEEAISDIIEVLTVNAMLENLPAAEDVTINDKEAIEATREAFEALTDEQKAQIDEDTLSKLTDAEEALALIEADIAAAQAVSDMIGALPNPFKVTTEDKEAIEEAAAAYEALTDAQKELVSFADRLRLTADQAALAAAEKYADDKDAADAVAVLIDALPSAADVTPDDKDAIEEAAAAYDDLTDDQKELVPLAAKLKLTADKAALTAAEKIAEDTAAADAVEELIRALPDAADVTLDDKAAVDEAKAAYDALTSDQKKMVNLTDRIKLAQDMVVIEKLENDKAAADAVTEQINALPAAEEVTYDDRDDIIAARLAYEALTDDQKALIDEDTYNKLTEDEEALAEVVEVLTVNEMIENLPAAEDVTINDKQAINDTRDAYDALSDDQKAKIDEDTYNKLTAAEEALALIEADVAAAQEVAEMIEALPEPYDVTLDDKDAIEEAAAAYEALTDAQKEYVPFEDMFKLTADQSALAAAEKYAEDKAAADAVTELINALPAANEVTLDDKAAIDDAYAAFDALTLDQKRMVGLADRLKLAQDMIVAATLAYDKEKADAVAEMINALPAPEDVTLDDKEAIEAARDAYDDLTRRQKGFIDEDTYKKLTDAEDALAALLDYIIGDANGDLSVDVRDVTAIQRHLAGIELLTGKNLLAADTNGDGEVTIDDATRLQMYLAEFDVTLG